ncbi:hypothetical protein F2Q69_00008790 [Brassica cretica]|uniref:Uncharacterized protein n=1 Tax=Brassica cretica TaxID=69181 RepID=A0A8S9PAG7_BRACR|nr:hypothetical protein F2Q69_00008790 [Brassica cretica]
MANYELLISELKSGRFMQTVVARRVKKRIHHSSSSKDATAEESRPGQLNKLLEKERQRAAENTQEYLAAKEEADTLEGRANQLELGAITKLRSLAGSHYFPFTVRLSSLKPGEKSDSVMLPIVVRRGERCKCNVCCFVLSRLFCAIKETHRICGSLGEIEFPLG